MSYPESLLDSGEKIWSTKPYSITTFKLPMPNIQLINPVQDPRWDKFVKNHPFGWVCHLSGWKEILEKSFNHIKGYYFIILNDSNSEIKAALPIFHVKSWLTGNRLVSIPFATLCDPLISTSDDLEKLFHAVCHYFKGEKYSYIEIKSFRSASIICDYNLYNKNYYKHHYLRLEEGLETIRKRFHRSCIKQRISRAIESGLKLETGRSETDLQDLYKLQCITQKRLGLPSKPYIFFKSIWEELSPSGNIQLLFAKKDNKRIAGVILFKYRDRVSAEVAVWDYNYMSLSPNHFLFWEAIKMAVEQGYSIFDFGRTSPNNKSLMDFKRRWGTEIIDLHQFYYAENIIKKQTANEESLQYHLMRKICNKTPSMFQEVIGNFCYRHLG